MIQRHFRCLVVGSEPHEIDLYQSKPEILQSLLKAFEGGWGVLSVLDVDSKPIPSLTLAIPQFYTSDDIKAHLNMWVDYLPTMMSNHAHGVLAPLRHKIATLQAYAKEVEYWGIQPSMDPKATMIPFRKPNLRY